MKLFGCDRLDWCLLSLWEEAVQVSGMWAPDVWGLAVEVTRSTGSAFVGAGGVPHGGSGFRNGACRPGIPRGGEGFTNKDPLPSSCPSANTCFPDQRIELKDKLVVWKRRQMLFSPDRAIVGTLQTPVLRSVLMGPASRLPTHRALSARPVCHLRTQKSQTLKSAMVFNPWGSLHLNLCIFPSNYAQRPGLDGY